ncbi:MAG: hypothetical protein ABEN55_07415 [Bradymonadaceae bacterium]
MSDSESSVVPVRWVGGLKDGYLEMIDQSRRTDGDVWLVMADADDIVDHVVDGAIRKPPALGTAAAYAVALIGRDAALAGEFDQMSKRLEDLADRLEEVRPDAVDLRWALDRMREGLDTSDDRPPRRIVERLFEEARTIAGELHADN